MSTPDDVIDQLYAEGRTMGRGGTWHQVHSAIDRTKGDFIRAIIRGDPDIKRTLEVGCAYGLSSLFICSELAARDGASHTLIDPYENTEWDGAGTLNLDRAGIAFYKLIEQPSEIAMPRMAANGEGSFDLVFVDGGHTFDQAFVDCYYATRLLRIGGVLIADDTWLLPVLRAVNYFRSLPCYETLDVVSEDRSKPLKAIVSRMMKTVARPVTWSKLLSAKLNKKLLDHPRTDMIALKKISEDARPWDWSTDSF